MEQTMQLMDSQAGFWLVVYAVSISIIAVFVLAGQLSRSRRGKRLTWELNSQFIDVSEFSNRNIPLKITYKGSEPRWLWASYLSLRNSGTIPVTSEDSPEKKQFIVGAPGCRYIGFNKLISEKAKVNLSPLFKGDDVYCRIEFDKLGAGDEILASLLFIAEEQRRVEVDGALFGSDSQIISGYVQRMQAWRNLWWLLIAMVALGLVGGFLFWNQSVVNRDAIMFQLQILSVVYFMALITAGLLLQPVRYWEQIPDRFNEQVRKKQDSIASRIKFLLGLSDPD